MASQATDLLGSYSDSYIVKHRDGMSRTEKIKYYIHDAVTLIDPLTRTYSWSHWDGHEKFIEDTFKDIDDDIDLDFSRTLNIAEAHIEIYRVSPDSPYVTKGGLLGLALDSDQAADRTRTPTLANKGLGKYQLVFWSGATNDTSPFLSDYYITRYNEAHTIIHEIGHALGLSHPQSGDIDDPRGRWHTDKDTVMSYNDNPYYSSTYFAISPKWSSADIASLRYIWGAENDHLLPVVTTNTDKSSSIYKVSNTYARQLISGSLSGAKVTLAQNSFDAKFYNLGEGRFGILQKGKTTIDEITGATTLQFQDQAISLASDVAATFNQVKGIDDVSGVVFRLYNAAFARLPDAKGLENWINGNKSGGQTYSSSAREFAKSQEFKNRYGSNVSDTQYVTTLYNNVLGRVPDAGGLAHYQGLLASGKDRGSLLLDFSESPENRTLFTKVTGLS